MKPSLRHFILLTAAAATLIRVQSNAATRPNILFILSDDDAWQAVSAYGESRHLIETPNIDRLANEGMRFDHCLVNNSLCGPSRASIITGTYSPARAPLKKEHLHLDLRFRTQNFLCSGIHLERA